MLTFDTITWTPAGTFPAVDAAARRVLAALAAGGPLPHLASDAVLRFESAAGAQSGEPALASIRTLKPGAIAASEAYRGLAGGTVVLHRARVTLARGALLVATVWMRRSGAWTLHELTACVLS